MVGLAIIALLGGCAAGNYRVAPASPGVPVQFIPDQWYRPAFLCEFAGTPYYTTAGWRCPRLM